MPFEVPFPFCFSNFENHPPPPSHSSPVREGFVVILLDKELYVTKESFLPGMRASVHVDLPGYTKEGLSVLKARCEELKVQPRGTRGESGGQTGITYDISNKHR